MEAIPFWSHPDVAKAIALLCVSLAGLFAAARAAVWGWAVYQRRKAERPPAITPRQYRRANDRRLLEVEKGLEAVRGGLATVSGRVAGLERDATFLTAKANEMGAQMERVQETQTVLLRFMDRVDEGMDWIKNALVRLENRAGRS